jgi:hypothetical protein
MSALPVPPATQEPSVRGGVDGIVAHCNEMRALAGRFGDAAHETAASTLALHGYLLDFGNWLSGLLDPAGFAAFEAEFGLALDLPGGGLSWCGVTCAALELELRAAAEAYQVADELDTRFGDLVKGALLSTPALLYGLATLATTADPGRAVNAVLATDPELADVAATALLTSPLAVGVVGSLPDGAGDATPTGIDVTGAAGTAPRRLTDIVEDIAQRNDDPRDGEIDVRILTMPDGTRRAIVDITGTKSWTFSPSSDVSDLRTDGRALLGEQTAYEQGVLKAMHDAGVRPGDDVMLVGHSEGGVVAVNAARDAVANGAFNVTHVVTLGAPIAGVVGSVSPKVQVLALENDKDLVVHADGSKNPDLPNVTTATTSHGDESVVDAHSIRDAYLPGAADDQASSDGSIRHFLTTADGYFRAESVETHTFQITRG